MIVATLKERTPKEHIFLNVNYIPVQKESHMKPFYNLQGTFYLSSI